MKDSHHENGDMHFQDKLVATNTTIHKMLTALEKWQEAQKVILSLNAVFSQQKMQTTLPHDFNKFQEIEKTYVKQVIEPSLLMPKAKQVLCSEVLVDTLEKLVTKCVLIQKGVEDALEAKRLAFPRFFFMTDKQFLEFLELSD